MAEVLVVYAATATDRNGTAHTARACTRERGRGRWEAWFEFAPIIVGGPVVRTSVETTQPDREAASRWASGISRVYLEGALARASEDGSAATLARAMVEAHEERERIEEREAVLDPLEVMAGGEEHLRRRLEALSTAHVRDVARAQRTASVEALERATKAELVRAIVAQTRARV